jgi:hypothetical protein
MQSSTSMPAQVRGSPKAPGLRWVLVVLAVLIMGVGLGSALAADAPPAPSPDLHTFTNQDGRTIKAAIFSAADDYVNLKRDDGQTFKVPVSTLSSDDQNFIRQWVIKQARTSGDDVLTMSVTSVRGESDTPQIATKSQLTTAWTEAYKIKVSNATPVHWANLQVRYIIFHLVGSPGILPPGNFKPAHANGTTALADLPGEQDQTVTTDKITLKEVSMQPGHFYDNGAPPKVTDVLQGVWVRVYDEKNNLLQEWAAPTSLMKDNNWDALFPPPRGRRGGAAARPASSG